MADPTPTPSFDTAPRLQPTAADPASAYAPIAWSAVAALGIGGLFAAALLILGYSSFQKKTPLVEPWLFAFAVIGIAVAFVARRQIASSEGTRIGGQYAAAGWWLCVVGGLIYAAYLGTLEYTVRADAAAQFATWTKNLPAVDPDAPDQPELFAAFYRTLPPQVRAEFNPEAFTDANDAGGAKRRAARETVRSRYGPLLLKFRQHPVLQQAVRYGDDCTFAAEGLKEWKYVGGKIECTLSAVMRTPEGDFPLVVPMEAMVERGNREWQVKLVEGNAAGAPLVTPYGLLVLGWVTPSARLMTEELLSIQRSTAHRKLIGGPDFVAAVGGLPAVVVGGPVPTHAAFAASPVVTLPGGVGAPAEDKLREFRTAWESEPRRFKMSDILGEGLAENPAAPGIDVAADRVVVRMPFQYQPRGAEVPGAGVRLKLVVACTDPAVVGELNAARATAATDARLADLPKDAPILKKTPILPGQWTLLRIESDLQTQRPPQQAGGPGGPGGPGG